MNHHSATNSVICPYKGLKYFEFNDTDPQYFFGRTALVDKLINKVRESNFLAVLGVSGCGKSSIIRAGLLHQLREGLRFSESKQWKLLAPITPTSNNRTPFENLASAFIEPNLIPIDHVDQFIKLTNIMTNVNGLKELIECYDSTKVILVIDQFEEIFSIGENERQKFFEYLMSAIEISTKLCLIIVMRADFRGECAKAEYYGLNHQIDTHQITITP